MSLFRKRPRPEPGRLLLERLEERLLLSADPVAAVAAPGESFINEDFGFSVSFDNTGADVGYAPFLDVVTPVGVDVSSATVLGSAADSQVIGYWDATDGRWEDQSDGSGNAVTTNPSLPGDSFDPAAPGSGQPANPGGKTGDIWYQVTLPFGSFTPEQPAVGVQFAATLNGQAADGAVVGEPLDIRATAGFKFGDTTPVNDPPPNGNDPPVYGLQATSPVVPTVLTLSKAAATTEGGTVTGPNFPVTYSITVDIANLETVDNIEIRDVLPNNLVYLPGTLSYTAGGVEIAVPQAGGPFNNNALGIDYAQFVGAPGPDIVITYQGWVAELDANGDEVLDPVTGTVANTVELEAEYTDGNGVTNALNEDDTETYEARSGQVQKGVSVVGDGEPVPGSTLEFRFEFQVSDFVQLNDVLFDDVLSDGLEFDAGFTPIYSVFQNGVNDQGDFLAGNFTVAPPAADGTIGLQFRLSDQIGGSLAGDLVNDADRDGATTGFVSYRATILSEFREPVPGNPNVDMGDSLGNDIELQAIRNSNGADGADVTDGSAAGVTVPGITVVKSIYELKDSTGAVLPQGSPIAPGDDVTYRIRFTLATGDVEDLTVVDYLPLPVFDATTVSKPAGLTNNPSNDAPDAGEIVFGPDHNLPGDPTPSAGSDGDAILRKPDGTDYDPATELAVLTDAAGNTVGFSFGSFGQPVGSDPYVVDLLFTVKTNDQPFADGLFLTNQALVGFSNSQGQLGGDGGIVQIQLRQPELTLKKGVISTSNDNLVGGVDQVLFDPDPPGPVDFSNPPDQPPFAPPPPPPPSPPITSAGLAANSIDSDADGVDAGDLVRYAILIENTGGKPAFDVLVRDDPADPAVDVPAGGSINLRVTRGNGTPVAFTDADGDPLTDADGNPLAVDAAINAALFGAGIRVVDDLPGGGSITSLDAGQNTGTNILIVTYDMQLADDVTASSDYTNEAELLEFAAGEGGADFTYDGGPFKDEATVTVLDPAVGKFLEATSQPDDISAGTDLVIGEQATYRLDVTVPEGLTGDFVITDDVPDGMAILLAGGNPLFNVDAAGFVGNLPAPVVTVAPGPGGDIRFDFGDITASATQASADNRFTITYIAEVLDVAGNSGLPGGQTVLTNGVSFDYAGNQEDGVPVGPRPGDPESVSLRVIEPLLRIDKTMQGPDDPALSDAATGDAGDTVTVHIEVENLGLAPAFDIEVLDEIGGLLTRDRFDSLVEVVTPAGFSYVPEAVTKQVDYQVDVANRLDPGDGPLVFEFTFDLTGEVQANEVLLNTATVNEYFTLPGGDGRQKGGELDTATVAVPAPAFAKGLVGTAIDDAGNGAGEVVIGETATYELVVTVPEGTTPDAQILDTLDAGLAFVEILSIVPSDPALTSDQGDFGNVALFLDSVGPQGSTVTFDLGTLTNAGSTNGQATETLTITYTAVALNLGLNQAGRDLGNDAKITAANGVNLNDDAPDVGLIEPAVTLTKDVAIQQQSPTFIQAGDTIVYTVTFAHPAPGSPTAFDLSLLDTLPLQMANPAVTAVNDSAGLLGVGDFDIDPATQVDTGGIPHSGDLQVAVQPDGTRTFDLETDRVVTVEVRGTVSIDATPDLAVTNVANADWTSLDGDARDLSPYVDDGSDRERTGEDPAGLDDYVSSDDAQFRIGTVQVEKGLVATSEDSTGFAGNRERVAIGEVARFRLTVKVPQASFADAQLRDLLPAGLQFVDDGTAKVAFVANDVDGANDGGFRSTNPSPAVASGENWSINVNADPLDPNSAFVKGNEDTINKPGWAPTFVLDVGDAGSGNFGTLSTRADLNDDNYAPGTDVFFKLGDVVNADLDADDEFIVVDFNAFVSNVNSSQGGIELLNRFHTVIDGNAFPDSNTVQLAVVEPLVELEKDIVQVPADAGDTIVYEFRATNARAPGDVDASSAFDIEILDDLDADLGAGVINLTGVVVDAAGAPGALVTDNTAGNRIEIDIDRLDPAEFVIIRVTGVLANDVPAGLVLANTATLTDTSLPGPNGTVVNPTGSTSGPPGGTTGERTGEDGPGPGNLVLNNYFTSDSASTRLDQPVADKVAPAKEFYTIGEDILWSLVIEIPEGESAEVVVEDLIPDGLSYRDHVFVTAAAASGGLLDQDYAGVLPADAVIGTGGTGVASTPPPNNSGDDLRIALGDLANPDDNNPDNDRFLLVVTTRVVNEAINESGQIRTNIGQLSYEDPADGLTLVPDPTGAPSIALVEPVLGMTKGVVSAPKVGLDGGDVVTYRVRIDNSVANGSTADAFDAVFDDVLPDYLSIVDKRITDKNGLPLLTALDFAVEDANGGTDNRIRTLAPIDLDLADFFVLEYDALISAQVPPEETLVNGAELTWTSLEPDANSGLLDGRRDGSDGGILGDGSLNDYRLTAQDSVETATIDTFDKAVIATDLPDTGIGQHDPANPDLAIGETVTFRLTAEIPEITLDSLVITDSLPALGAVNLLAIDAADTRFRADLSDQNLSAAPVIAFPDASTVIWTFGNLTNEVDPVPDARTNRIVFDLVATVRDIPQNSDGDLLTNEAELDFAAGAVVGNLADSADLDLVEPSVLLTKAITSAPVVDLDAGDPVTYEIRIENLAANGATAPAYDLDLSDTLDPKLLVAGPVNVQVQNGTIAPPNANVVGGGTGISLDTFTLPLDEVVVVTYAARLQQSVAPGATLGNNVDGDWYSAPSALPESRSYDGSDRETVTAATLAVDKSITDTSVPETTDSAIQPGVIDLTIGEEVTYRITVTVPEVSAGDIVVTDVLPTVAADGGVLGLVNASFEAGLSDANLSFAALNLATADTDGDGIDDRVTFTVTDLVNAPDAAPDARTNKMVFEIVARAEDVAANASGDVLTNEASLAFVDAGAGPVTLADDADVAIVESLLLFEKTANTNAANVGDVVTYTVQVAHDPASTGPAFDVLIEDLLLEGQGANDKLDLVVGSVVTTEGVVVAGNAPGDTTVRVEVATYDKGSPPIIVSFQAQVNANTNAIADVIVNTATADRDSLPGPGGRVYPQVDDDHTLNVPLDPNDPQLSKAVIGTSSDHTGAAGPVEQLAIGERVTYELQAVLGPGAYLAGDDLIITDSLPAFLYFPVDPGPGNLIPGADVSINGASVAVNDTDGDGFNDQVVYTIDVDRVQVGAGPLSDKSILVRLEAQVLNAAGNQAGNVLTNQGQMDLLDNAGNVVVTKQDAVDVELVEPELTLAKQRVAETVSSPTGDLDAGDTVTYRVSLAHDGAGSTAAALGVIVEDTLPGFAAIVPGSVQVIAGPAGVGAGNFLAAGNSLTTITPFDLDLAESLVLEYRVRVLDTVTPGAIPTVLDNGARIEWTSMPDAVNPGPGPAGPSGAANGERDASDGGVLGDGSLNDYAAEATTSRDVATLLTADKTIGGGRAEFTAGERVTYAIEVGVMEGTTPDLILTDVLPEGTEYVAGSFTIVPGAQFTQLAGAPVYDANTRTLTMSLGDVVNTGNNNPIDDRFTVTYRALVLDDPGNQSGVAKQNDVTVTATGPGPAVDDETFTFVEPLLVMDKALSSGIAAGLDAGDPVTYTVTLEHDQDGAGLDSTATAFDVVFRDAVPADMRILRVDGVGGNAGLVEADFTISPDGLVLTSTSFDLALGDDLIVTYTSVLRDSVAPGEVLTNNARTDWTSTDGPDPDERVYQVTDSLVVTAGSALQVDKAVAGTSIPLTGKAEYDPALDDVVVGEEVTYRTAVTLFEGTTENVVVVDTLPAGLAVDPASVARLPGFAGATEKFDVAVAGNVLTIDLGRVVNPGDNDPLNDVLGLSYQVLVLDDPVNNVDGDEKENSVTVSADGLPGAGDTAKVEIVEPELVIDKTANANLANVGDILTYTITVNHTQASTGPAYNLVITDDLLNGVPGGVTDQDLGLIVGSVAASDGVVVTGNNPGDTGIRVEVGTYALGAAAPVVITFDARLEATLIAAGDQMQNTIGLDWESAPALGRPGSAADDHTVDIPADAATPEFGKQVAGTSFDFTGSGEHDPVLPDVTVGELVTYRLATLLRPGAYPGGPDDLVISDTLPAGMELVGLPAVTYGNDVSPDIAVYPAGYEVVLNPGAGRDFEVRFDLDFVDIGDPAAPFIKEKLVVVEYEARVLDLAPPVVDGAQLVNAGELDFAPTNEQFAADTSVDVVEPALEVAKTVDDDSPALGQRVTYSVEVVHDPASTSDAYDLVLEDDLADPWITLVPGSVVVAGVDPAGVTIVSGNAAGDTGIEVEIDSVALDRLNPVVLRLTYQADVSSDLAAYGQQADNTASLAYDNVPGDVPVERDYNGQAVESALISGPDMAVTKDDGRISVNPGENLTYAIVLTNQAAGPAAADATNVTVVDTLPDDVVFVAAPGGIYDSAAGTVTFDLGVVAPGEVRNLSITIGVRDPAPAGLETLLNGVAVTHDDIDPTPADNLDTDITLVDAEPLLSITKDDGRARVEPGDPIRYGIVVTNSGNQDASGVVVTDRYPIGTLENMTADQGGVVDPAAGIVTWDLGTLAGGRTLILTLSGNVKPVIAAGIDTIANDVLVRDDGAGTGGIPLVDRDDDLDLLDASPDYLIVKDDGLTEVLPTERVTYVVEVTNKGNQDGTGVVIVDRYPVDLLVNVSAAGGGVVDPVAGTVTWAIGDLDVGETLTLSFGGDVVRLPPPGSTQLLNLVTVTDDGRNGPDPTPGDNRDTDVTRLTPAAPDYRVTKTDGLDEARAGDLVTYLIRVENIGNLFGTSVVITDAYPAELLVGVTASNGGVVNANAGTVTWTLARLDAGERVELSFSGTLVQVVPPGTDQVVNRVTVEDDGRSGLDPDISNNQAVDTTDLLTYVYDGIRDPAEFERESVFGALADDPRYPAAPSLGPIYTGVARPGAAVTLVLYDEMGESIGYRTVVADMAGNWLIGLSGVSMSDHPHRVLLSQADSSFATATTDVLQLRDYFFPALVSPSTFTEGYSVESVLFNVSPSSNDVLAERLEHPLWEHVVERDGAGFLLPRTIASDLDRL